MFMGLRSAKLISGKNDLQVFKILLCCVGLLTYYMKTRKRGPGGGGMLIYTYTE